MIQPILHVQLDWGTEIIRVGHLAYRDRVCYFEYDKTFLETNLEISPFKLPLQAGLISGDPALFDGLPGVFNDSLPDGWGRLLLDRAVRAYGILPESLTPLDRLAYVGSQGIGALTYEPAHEINTTQQSTLDLSLLAKAAQQILQGASSDMLNELLNLNGSSAGARPKAMIGLNEKHNHIISGSNALPDSYEHWLVKFTNTSETIDAGAVEHMYAEMARTAGIHIMESTLLPAKHGPGFFATKRFDRYHSERYHIISACGLLHSDFRAPCLDYQDLLKATELLTKSYDSVVALYRIAVFNILAHNRDDHSKNISFMMNQTGKWELAPAYDLTFSSGPNGEQSTMVMGKGRDISTSDLLILAQYASIAKADAQETIDCIRNALSQWTVLAKQYGVTTETQQLMKQSGINT